MAVHVAGTVGWTPRPSIRVAAGPWQVRLDPTGGLQLRGVPAITEDQLELPLAS